MRGTHSRARTELPADYSPVQTLVVACAMALATVTAVLVVLYPRVAALAVAGAGVSWLLAAVAVRVRLTRRAPRRYLLVRVPFTGYRLEV